MTELTVTDLHKSFGATPVLTGVHLTARSGALTAVLGPSGSGKTTLLRVMAGFEAADRGRVCLGGECVDDGEHLVPAERRHIGYVPQEGCLFPHMSVAANVAFGLPRGRAGGARVDELLDLVGLHGLGKRRPHELSGGQQQRVALARALAPRPRMVLLDEPFSSLDTGLRSSLRDDVCEVLRHEGTTAVLVTHDQDEALSLADVVAVLREGRVVQVGAPKELYDSPVDQELARFVGMANLLPGVVHGGAVETSLGRLHLVNRGAPGVAGRRATILIRPEQLTVGCDPDCPLATVARVDYHGHDAVMRLSLRVRDQTTELLARIPPEMTVLPGDLVSVSVRGQVHAWPAAEDGHPRNGHPDQPADVAGRVRGTPLA